MLYTCATTPGVRSVKIDSEKNLSNCCVWLIQINAFPFLSAISLLQLIQTHFSSSITHRTSVESAALKDTPEVPALSHHFNSTPLVPAEN